VLSHSETLRALSNTQNRKLNVKAAHHTPTQSRRTSQRHAATLSQFASGKLAYIISNFTSRVMCRLTEPLLFWLLCFEGPC
jgi:hypothetical protein